jgi:signal transduction histidine kinase
MMPISIAMSHGSEVRLPSSPEPDGLWVVLNRPRPFDVKTTQILCGFLAAIYLPMAILRYAPAHPEFLLVRGFIGLYGFVGMTLASRFSFGGLRAYTVGLAFLASLGGGYVAAVLGNEPAQLPLTGLCTFVAVVFLQTGLDVACVVPALALGQAAMLVVWPPEHVAMAAVVVMIASSLVIGASVCIIVVGYSGRLNERVRWWQDACERERAALRAKSEFLSTMSHELRSPLHVIVGYADMMRDDVASALREPLARIRQGALDLLHLVENTMNASRLEAGKLALHVETVEPAPLFREIAENVQALPEAKRGVPVRWHVPPALPPVEVDRLKLKEIVQNLVSNALKFTREGEVTIDVAGDAALLTIRVRDTGPGIDPASHARIFEMFERVESDGTADRPPGVGLGLYIVQSLVALMSGTIAVESAPGATTFTVRIPVRPETSSRGGGEWVTEAARADGVARPAKPARQARYA